MAFVPISTLFIVARSTWNALKLANDEAALDDELEKYRDPEFFFENLSDPYLKLEAKNKLLLAEYQVEREKLLRAGSPEEVGLLWRRLTKRMDTNLRSTAEELKMQPANLYQIAVLSTGLAKVVGETENELDRLSHRTDEASRRVAECERELGQLDAELKSMEAIIESWRDGLCKVVDLKVEGVRANLRRLQGELAGAREAIAELRETVSLQIQTTQELVANLKNSFDCKFSALKAELGQDLQEQAMLLQQLGEKVAELKRWFWIAVGWLVLLTITAVLS